MDVIAAILGAVLLAQVIDARVAVPLVAVGFIATRFLIRRRKIAAAAKELGLPPEDTSRVMDDLQRGNRQAAVDRIASAQEVMRSQLQPKGIDNSAIRAEVGREIAWTAVVRHVFRVLEFDRTGTSIDAGNQVKPLTNTGAYGISLSSLPYSLNRCGCRLAIATTFCSPRACSTSLNFLKLPRMRNCS